MANLILEIEQDIAREYIREKGSELKIKDFIQKYNSKNNNPITASPCIKLFRRLKGIPYEKSIYTQKTFEKKIKRFKKLSPEAKVMFMDSNNRNWGGIRENIRKMTDETILCLITLMLDFPTLSTTTYLTYLNSKYGPNYKNNITLRTVERYLKYIGFNVKRAAFAPPNRNYVGARIFRVAWCQVINEILNNSNLLLGFIDEAAITSCEGKNHGRAFTGITPLCNCPLNKVKMSVIALIFPGFGVLYKNFVLLSNKGDFAWKRTPNSHGGKNSASG